MKKIVGLVVLVSCLVISLPALANDEDVAARTQLQVSIDHLFLENEKVTGFAYGIFMYDLNTQYSVLFGYVGPMWKFGKVNVYTLGVTMNDAYGWSVGPSLWLEYAGEKNYFFVEYDHYEGYMSTQHGPDAVVPTSSYYALLDGNRAIKDKVAVGAALEIIGLYEDDQPFAMAYGPYVQMGKFKVWAFYDETPLNPGANYFGLRFKFAI